MVLLYCNEPVINPNAVAETAATIIEQRMQDCMYLIGNNIDEIIERAMAGRQ